MVPVIDMHCDTISVIMDNEESRYKALKETLKKAGKINEFDSLKDDYEHFKSEYDDFCTLRSNKLFIDLERLKKSGYMCQCFGLYTPLEDVLNSGISPYEHAIRLSDTFDKQMALNTDIISVVTTGSQIEENYKSGRLSALKTIEEGAVFEGDINKLHDFYNRGVRKSTLTWNYKNELAFPNPIVYDFEKEKYISAGSDTVNGLTETGFQFIKEMERIGMIIDISHLNDAGIWDILNTLDPSTPIVASHSNARSIVDLPRNLSDEMLKALAERGGVAGINFGACFLDSNFDNNFGKLEYDGRISDIIKHMQHMKNVAGVDVIGIGTDFDGIGGRMEINGAGEMQKLCDALSVSGFTSEEIEKIMYKNALRVYKTVLG